MVSIYDSKEWKQLSLDNRAYLIPTIEGLRTGATITPHETEEKLLLEYCLEETNLKYEKRGATLFVSRDEVALEEIIILSDIIDMVKISPALVSLKFNDATKVEYQALLEKFEKATIEAKRLYHMKLGKVLKYPECCIKNFLKHTLVLKETMMRNDWGKTAKKALEEGKFNEVFYYTFHVPCELDCKETIKIAKDIKTILELNDHEAAEWLKQSIQILMK